MKSKRRPCCYVNCILAAISIVCIVLMFFSSCKTNTVVKYLPSKDSVRVEVSERTIVQRDTVILEIPSQFVKQTSKDSTSHLETDYAESDASINEDGTLSHTLNNKSNPHEKEVEIPVRYITKTEYREKEVPVMVEVEKELTLWEGVKVKFGGFAIFVCFMIVTIIIYMMIKSLRK